MRKKSKEFKVYYSEFFKEKEIDELLKKLSDLAKLNILLEKKLLTKAEYEKVKCAIGLSAEF